MNPLESAEKTNFSFKDEFSDLVSLHDKSNVTEEQVKDLLNTHYKKFGRIGFSSGDPPRHTPEDYLQAFYNHLTNSSKEYKEDEKRFLEEINTEETSNIIKQGIERSKAFFPNNLINPEAVLLYCGSITDGKKINEREFGVNLRNLFRRVYKPKERHYDLEDTNNRIKTLIAHESTHIFTDQLESDKDKVKSLIHVVFDEGLATFIEGYHYPWHDDYKNDYEFWTGVVREAAYPNSQEDMRSTLLKISTNDIQKKYDPEVSTMIIERLSNKDIIRDKEFDAYMRRALVQRNGPLYHLGCKLWEDIYKEGGMGAVKKKILEGPKSFEKYFLQFYQYESK